MSEVTKQLLESYDIEDVRSRYQSYVFRHLQAFTLSEVVACKFDPYNLCFSLKSGGAKHGLTCL